MSKTKTELRFFDVVEYEKEAEYLSEMHAHGWKFVRVTFPGIYHFIECEPENVTYCLDYNREGAAHFAEYQQMFADLGWEYLFDFVGYSYFRKSNAGPEDVDIFCDDDSRWDMMKRVFRGRMIPLIVIFFAAVVPQLVWSIYGSFVERTVSYTAVVCAFAMLLLYLSIFTRFTVKYLAYKRKMGR